MIIGRFIQRAVDVATVAVTVAGYATFFWVTRGLWSVPPGSSIRPMGLAGLLFLLAVCTPVATIVVSNFAPVRRSTRVSDVACLASLGLFPLAFVYVPLVARLRGFNLGD